MKHLYIILSCMSICQIARTQETIPILEREVSLAIHNESVGYILNATAQQAGFVFSYSPDVIDASEKTSISVQGKSVRHVLNTLFNGTVRYKPRGKYLILLRNNEPPVAEKKEALIEGYLYDSQTGQKLTEATVYSKESMTAAITDRYGYFKIEVPAEDSGTELKVSKAGYKDTLIAPIQGKTSYVNIELSSRKPAEELPVFVTPKEEKVQKRFKLSKVELPELNVPQFKMPEWLIPEKLLINTRNISDTLFRSVQVSAIPFVSTNRLLSGSTVNDYSINMTIGYIKGVRRVELGGIANIVKEDAGYCQLAGVANVVGGIAYGFQAAGTFNIVKMMYGVQSAGVINIVRDDAGYCQLGGTGNFVGGKFYGFQGAGTFNLSSALKGVQVGGVTNLTGDAEGVQVAGVFNHASKIVGTQVAGILNNTDSLDGVQVAGVFNRASYFRGYQVGAVNYADSCDGIPFGLLSIVRKGYHKLEFAGDEVFNANVAFRSGVRKFHSILSAGIQPNDFGNPLWTFGYGVGTSFGKSDKFLFDIDFSANQVMKGNHIASVNTLNKLTLGLDWRFAPQTSLTLGVTYNIYVTNSQSKYYDSIYSSVMPYTLTDETDHSGINIKTWVGGRLGIRFF